MEEKELTYLCKFDENGRRGETYLSCEYSDEEKQEMFNKGFVEIDESEWNYYVGNMGEGDNGTGYIRDPQTGKPVSAPPYVPSKEEKLSKLEAEYEQESAELEKYYNKANIKNDTELMAELRDEMANLESEYEAKRKEIEEGE
jgi:hypothetical protein